MYSYGPPHMAVQNQDDQHEHTFSSYVRIRDVVLNTYLGRWTIGRSGERGSGISVLPARDDDDDDDDKMLHHSLSKNGDLRITKNYWGITFIIIAAKVYNALSLNRIWLQVENILRDYIKIFSTLGQIRLSVINLTSYNDF